MRKFAIGLCLLGIASVTACATPKSWSAMGGSRADATVTLGYQYGPFESPQITESGDELARQRCAVWGYDGAEAFGAVMQQCVSWSSSGCMSTQVTKTYQCTGDGQAGGSVYIDMTPDA